MKYYSEDIVREMVKEAEDIAFVRSCGVKTKSLDINDYPSIEIPDKHGRLIDGDKLERRIKYISCDNCYPQSNDDCRGCSMRNIVNEVKSMTTIVEANEAFAKELKKYDEKVALNRERRIEDGHTDS